METLPNKNKSKKRPTNSNNILAGAWFHRRAKACKNTKKKKTMYDINVWKRNLTSAGKEKNTEDIPAKDLNLDMSRFFMEIKKKDGWWPVRAHNTDFISSKSTTISERTWLNTQYPERPTVFLVPSGPFLKKGKAVVTRLWQGKSPTSRSSLDRCRRGFDLWARRIEYRSDDVTKMTFFEIMGYTEIFWKYMMKNAYLPKITILLQFWDEILALSCSNDSIQILVILFWF